MVKKIILGHQRSTYTYRAVTKHMYTTGHPCSVARYECKMKAIRAALIIIARVRTLSRFPRHNYPLSSYLVPSTPFSYSILLYFTSLHYFTSFSILLYNCYFISI